MVSYVPAGFLPWMKTHPPSLFGSSPDLPVFPLHIAKCLTSSMTLLLGKILGNTGTVMAPLQAGSVAGARAYRSVKTKVCYSLMVQELEGTECTLTRGFSAFYRNPIQSQS